MGALFGTDGIRGTAGQYPLDPSTLFRLGGQVARLGARSVVIGRDTRTSGVWMQQALQKGVEAQGGSVTLAGVMTTPGIAYLAGTSSFDAGIVISASHNPSQDNGIKIFFGDGTKLSDQDEEHIERAVTQDESRFPMPSIEAKSLLPQLALSDQACVESYLNFLKGILADRSLEHLKIVLDCAHGAAVNLASEVFRELGAEIIVLNAEPDGCNINQQCGSLYPQQMARTVVQCGASLGVSFDGDSDRSIFADENGKVLDGDYILYVLSRYLHVRGKMNSGCLVTTVMANMGLDIALRAEGLMTVRTRVGDRHVLEEMLRSGHDLGGEQSGHIIIREHSLAGDGILTALKVAHVIVEEGRSLGELAKGLEKFPQILVNVPIKQKQDFTKIGEIQSEIEAVKGKLGERGRVVIRYSGTELLARIMLEGESEEELKRYAETLAGRFREKLG